MKTVRKTWDPKSDYAKKLQDPRWQKKRLEIMQRDNFRCVMCGDQESMLQVHHKHYETNNPWDAQNKHLMTLCKDCHEFEGENLKDQINGLIMMLKEKGFDSFDFQQLMMTLDNEKMDEHRRSINAFMVIEFLFKDDELWNIALSKMKDEELKRIAFSKTPQGKEQARITEIELAKGF